MEFKDSIGNLDPKEVANLQETCVSIFNLYSSTFGSCRRVPVAVLPPIEASRSYIGDGIDMSIPRGKYNIAVGIMGLREEKIIKGIQFGEDVVNFVKGDPTIVDPENSRDVFRTILAHELIHSQIAPRAVVGVEPAPLLPHDIRFGGSIHYVLGFKAVSVNLKDGFKNNPTELLDEYITQYLAMTMTNSFEQKNPVLEKMKIHGLGINAEKIIGAEILNEVFSKHDITPQAVESFHKKSDIKGFLMMLKKIDSKLSGIILAAGIEPDLKRSIKKLKELK